MHLALTSLMEDAMHSLSDKTSLVRCAYCGQPFAFNGFGVEAWQVGDRFVCNEFCADGLPDQRQSVEPAPPGSEDLHVK
jgi:hypothetical protein